MGNCISSAEPTQGDKVQVAVSRRIDAEIAREANSTATIMKLLLLGPGESGKSTVLKQMRIIHQNGFSDAEILNRRGAVYSNTVQSMWMLLNGMDQLGIKTVVDRELDIALVRKTVAREEDSMPLSKELYAALKNLWSDKQVQLAYTRRNEFQINDSAEYFLDNLDRIQSESYVPTIQDILLTRVATIGVSEIEYTYKDITFRIFDVGGQKSERRKWIHCFDNVNAILFIVAISEYDQTLREDGVTNRMTDSLALFYDIVNSEFFRDAQVILFLNKKDLFEEKIKRVPLTIAFIDYKGAMDYEHTTTFLKRKFEKLKNDPDKMIYSHLTCATDTNQVQLVLNSATDMIIAENFKQTGVM